MGFVEIIHGWTKAKIEQNLLRRFGMIRTCPWCNQIVETDGNHKMKTCEHNAMWDTFTCGVCGGESHWLFSAVPHYMGHGNGPEPKFGKGTNNV